MLSYNGMIALFFISIGGIHSMSYPPFLGTFFEGVNKVSTCVSKFTGLAVPSR